MIAYLEGKILDKKPVKVILFCNGVGFEVNIPITTFDNLPAVGEITQLHIHYSFNENDGVKLFGFISKNEKEMFGKLLNISKIGPKIALSILSALKLEDLIMAVQTKDVSLLSTVPGIGKKSAERLIIELKDKVNEIEIKGSSIPEMEETNTLFTEAESALITLGYKKFIVAKTLRKLLKENHFKSSEEIIKAAIKTLYKKR